VKTWRNISPILSAALLSLTLVTTARAMTTYTLAGGDYDPASRTGIYASATGITGSFTTKSPLPANLSNAPIANTPGGLGLVKNWSFNDGVFTYTKANSAIYQGKGIYFQVSTDAGGAVTSFRIVLEMPFPGAAVGQAAEFLYLGFTPGVVQVVRGNCDSVTPEGGLPPAGRCELLIGPDVTDVASSPNPGSATFSPSTTCTKVNKKGKCPPKKKHP